MVVVVIVKRYKRWSKMWLVEWVLTATWSSLVAHTIVWVTNWSCTNATLTSTREGNRHVGGGLACLRLGFWSNFFIQLREVCIISPQTNRRGSLFKLVWYSSSLQKPETSGGHLTKHVHMNINLESLGFYHGLFCLKLSEANDH